MNKKTFNIIFLGILVISDVCAFFLSFILAYKIRFFSSIKVLYGVPPIEPYINAFVFFIIISIIVFKTTGMYKEKKIYSLLDEFYSIFIAISIILVISMAITFMYRGFQFSRLVLLLMYILSIIFVNLFRAIVYQIKIYFRKRNYGIDNILIIGESTPLSHFTERIKNSKDSGYNIIGKVVKNNTQINKRSDVLGTIANIPELIKKYSVSEIFLPLSFSSDKEIQQILLQEELQNIKLTFIPDTYELITTKLKLNVIEGIPVLTVQDISLSPLNQIIKRSTDLILGITFFILMLPIFLLICALIKYSKRLSSPGPALFKQERVGLNNKPFVLYKFRTMIVDAEKETGPVWAEKNDKRRTKIGKFLRKTSLDELPQFINVLKGEMSLVGPRPERPFFVDKFQKEVIRYLDRHKAKPGITGWAQINELRGNVDINLRTQYDLYYVENWSLLLDIKIILRTIFEILFHKSAY